MAIDPALAVVAGALSTVAAVLYRELLKRAERAEADADFWREYALREVGLTDIATEQAERRAPLKRRTR